MKLTEVDILALAEMRTAELTNTDVDEMRIYRGIKRRCQELEKDEDIKNRKVQSENFINTDGGWKAMAKVASFPTDFFNTIVEPFLNKWLSGETAKYSQKAQPRRKDGRPSLFMFKYIWPTGEDKDDAERYNLLATNIDLFTELGKVVDCSTDEKRAAAVKIMEVKKASAAGKKETKRGASFIRTSKKKNIKQEKMDNARLDYLERLVSRQRKIIKLVSLKAVETVRVATPTIIFQSRDTLNLTGHLAILYQNDQLLFIKKWFKSGVKEYHSFGECNTQRNSFKKVKTIKNKELGSVRFVIESPNFQYDFATGTINNTSWCGFNNDMEYDEELSEEEEEEENFDDNATVQLQL
ncbi:hypothetical protein BV898_18231 [Hypsibius exemplaris]|uniref:Uncharacterized protein n=1 Tax=Hypsibius exemplaris TaxID=2072580 RepID=A0A9X6RMV7_HYPEX|nr:hypothetical protein BV898_18231 [Hypsibius exemplaris]